jgi:hypothetical protein
MQDWENERRVETGPVFEDVFPAGPPSERLEQRLRLIGKRRKRFTGWKRTAHATWAVVVLAVGAGLAVLLGLLAIVLPGDLAGLRVVLGLLAVALLAGGVVLAWWLRTAYLRAAGADAQTFDFHESGGVYADARRVHVFSWSIIGRVIFAPDSEPGRVSELILSLAPEAPVREGETVRIEYLPNSLLLTSEYFPLGDLHKMARRLHALLGHLKVVARPRDRKLYRLD